MRRHSITMCCVNELQAFFKKSIKTWFNVEPRIQRLKIATKACHIPMLTLARVNVMIQVFINAIIVAAESIGINDSHTVAVLAMINGTCKSVEYIFNFEHKAECLKQILRNIHELEHDVKLLQIHQKHPECHDLIRQDIQKFNTVGID